MDRSKFYLVVAALVVVGLLAYKKLSSKSYEPIVFMGETYLHVEDNEVNRVENHMFTPGGVAVAETDEFIQISKVRPPGPDCAAGSPRAAAGDQQFSACGRSRAPKTGSLACLRARCRLRVHEKPMRFVLKVGPKHRAADREALRDGAGVHIDELSSVSSF